MLCSIHVGLAATTSNATHKIINDHSGKIEFIPIDDGAKIEIIFSKK